MEIGMSTALAYDKDKQLAQYGHGMYMALTQNGHDRDTILAQHNITVLTHDRHGMDTSLTQH